MIFICYPKCSVCQQAQKWLEDNKITFTSRNITENKPTSDEIKMWQEKSGLSMKELINTNDSCCKEKNLKDKISTMSDDEICKLFLDEPLLLKRPIVVTDKCVLVGFDETKWKEKLL